ncbi:glutamyl-tRNA amidotransferase [Boeremia exigua]|uniref:glutamyl-tRNA amidotransferase n=1 Tax=Boeremia exigua TaxID=749465 RepID=UPI001E8E018D|nr:glutamyl-tRNA amidotransferase [Boeremia exigua]KAH6622480.1 glutamyl-tRNA amidotransferase [Boeremia exigua]
MSLQTITFWLGLLSTVFSFAQAIRTTGTTVYLDGITYWIPPDVIGSLDKTFTTRLFDAHTLAAELFLALTVISTGLGNYSQTSLEHDLSRFQARDDVWSDGFANMVYLQVTPREHGDSRALSERTWGNRTILFAEERVYERLPDGPYFLSSRGSIHRAYRLYSDHQEAFVESVYTDPSGSHFILPAHISGNGLTIAVPSRLYYTPTPTKPLAGMRLGIKDIFDLSGVKSGNGNRAWYNLYPPANVTAPAVQRLLDAGAIIVGKQKTAQFANGEYATADWIDYHSPFNPRGDGYQDPNFSSAGAGASVASYEWLDFALGSDTGGSIRGPARVSGLYGLRPSHGTTSLQFTLPLAPEFDTAALIVRDPLLLHDAATKLYALTRNRSHNPFPTQLLVEKFPVGLTNETVTILDQFLNEVKVVLSAETINWFNMTTSWQDSRPKSAPTDLQVLMANTYATIISQRQKTLVRDPFYTQYALLHDGRSPAVNPVPLTRWAFGDAQPPTALADALNNKTVFMEWFQDHVLKEDPRSCTSAILAYVSPPSVQYRNTYKIPPTVPTGFNNQYWSVMAESPDISIPIGQMSYDSVITNHKEQLPVSINFMVAKGCDLVLLNVITKLYHRGVLKASAVGASAVDGGEILQRR